jgi:hypothetical protein
MAKNRRSTEFAKPEPHDDHYVEEADMLYAFPPVRFRKGDHEMSVLMTG